MVGRHRLMCGDATSEEDVATLILAVNKGLKKGELSDVDMQYLRTGALMQTILSLPEDERLKEKREVTSEEVINKIKVLNNIEDQETKAARIADMLISKYGKESQVIKMLNL